MTSVSEKIRLARERSKKRKELLGFTLGSSWAEELGSESKKVKNVNVTVPTTTSVASSTSTLSGGPSDTSTGGHLCDVDDKQQSHTEEFRDSTAFLKGTQSLNPHNDYSQNFVDTGHRPQNFIRE